MAREGDGPGVHAEGSGAIVRESRDGEAFRTAISEGDYARVRQAMTGATSGRGGANQERMRYSRR